MALKKGSSKIPQSGRKAGTRNKTTQAIKGVIESVFNDLQSHPEVNLYSWAVLNPTEFYKLAMKLLPYQVDITADTQNSTIIMLGGEVLQVFDPTKHN